MKYEKPLIAVIGSGVPTCNNGSAASIDNPGCNTGKMFASGYDCGNGPTPEDYCLDGAAPTGVCKIGTGGTGDQSRCYAGGTPI